MPSRACRCEPKPYDFGQELMDYRAGENFNSRTHDKGTMKSFNEEIEHLKSIPWVSRHLQDPNLVLQTLSSRTPKARSEDAFFGDLLNTSDAISALVIAYIRPDRPGSSIQQVKGFITLGNKVDGWSGICHGGVVATLFDEVPTMLTRVNAPGRSFVTASLNVKYLSFVKTPGTIMVVSKLKQVQGRKVFVESVIEDENGKKLAEAHIILVEARAKL